MTANAKESRKHALVASNHEPVLIVLGLANTIQLVVLGGDRKSILLLILWFL
jgi:hypothetical protein